MDGPCGGHIVTPAITGKGVPCLVSCLASQYVGSWLLVAGTIGGNHALDV